MKPETLEKMLVKCAEQDGWKFDGIVFTSPQGIRFRPIDGVENFLLRNDCAYNTSHDALQPLIDKMDFKQIVLYDAILWDLCGSRSLCEYKATCSQKFTAYCLVMGWITTEEE